MGRPGSRNRGSFIERVAPRSGVGPAMVTSRSEVRLWSVVTSSSTEPIRAELGDYSELAGTLTNAPRLFVLGTGNRCAVPQ